LDCKSDDYLSYFCAGCNTEENNVDYTSFFSNCEVNFFPNSASNSKNPYSEIRSAEYLNQNIDFHSPKLIFQYPSNPNIDLNTHYSSVSKTHYTSQLLNGVKNSEKRKGIKLCSNDECFNIMEERGKFCCKQCATRKYNLNRKVSTFYFIINIYLNYYYYYC
jgi:hypothetical protein